jgi:hypothetical protein
MVCGVWDKKRHEKDLMNTRGIKTRAEASKGFVMAIIVA